MVKEGSWAWSKTRKSRAKVIEVVDLWGVSQVRLWFPREDIVLLHGLDEIEPDRDSSDSTADQKTLVPELRFAAALGKVADLINDEKLLSPIDSAVTPLPHQIKALKKLLGRDRVRFLLADEVGLGKTIEAGLAIKELKMRGRVRRVLVIAPKGLIPQWIVEMRERFGEDFRHFEPSAFEDFRKMTGSHNVWSSHDRVICSMDAIKPLETRKGWSMEQVEAYNQERIVDLSAAGWDLVIIDEAHRVAGSADTVARHKMAHMVTEAAPSVLLLSATPHQGKSDSFHRLMRLLDKDAFPDEESVSRERVAPYVVRTEKRNAKDNKGSALFAPRLTNLIPVPWGEHHDQKDLYEAVTEYVQEGYNRALAEKNTSYGFLMILMQRLVTSSTAAISKTLERRVDALSQPEEQLQLFSQAELDELQSQDGETQLDAVLKKQIKALKNEKAEVELLLDASRKVMARGPDAKAEALLDLIYRLQQDEADPKLKVLIFTEFVPTQNMLAEFLRGTGYSVVLLNGSMGLEDRKATQKAFSEDAQIMISTDAGGEGLNLQFCHVVINFDLGWRPMALEQRIGRVDRIGQKKVVKAINLVLEDSVEFRVRDVLEEKLGVIFREFGIDKTSDVLDSEDGAHMFDKLFVDALLEPTKIEQGVEDVVDAVRNGANWNREQLNVLGADEEEVSLEKDVSTQPVRDYLDILVRSHVESDDGGEYQASENGILVRWPGMERTEHYHFAGSKETLGSELLTLDHSKIRELMGKVPAHYPDEVIPKIKLQGLPGGKGGFWSLWQLRFGTNESIIREFFPVFTNPEGRSFDRSAHSIWDALLNNDMQEDGFSDESTKELFSLHEQMARQSGEPVFRKLKEKHKRFHDEREANERRHFEVRANQLNQIGLVEVRRFRQRQLEIEQENWLRELPGQRAIRPELTLCTLVELLNG
jgi:SNF2 family DNA or RNA helicase